MTDCSFVVLLSPLNLRILLYLSYLWSSQNYIQHFKYFILVQIFSVLTPHPFVIHHSFVSEHIETLEEIDVEYKELALKSGIENWGRVPALNCEPTFITDLADAVIESLPYVGAMAVSNIEARQVNCPVMQIFK